MLLPSYFAAKLKKRDDSHQRRCLLPISNQNDVTVTIGEKDYLNFCSNDYLGLSRHPHLIASSSRYLQKYGAGAGASRLISGNMAIHEEVEKRLAKLYGSESTLLFGTGFQANCTLIPCLIGSEGAIFADRSCHHSMIHGAVHSGAKLFRFRHNDLSHLQELLTKHARNYNRTLIMSETLFSMEGDMPELDCLQKIARSYDAELYLDDAHALGVFGARGMGLAADKPTIPYRVGTFGKAFGCSGAFIACSHAMREYLINFCPGFIYTTAPPPAVLGAIMGALDLIEEMGSERARLLSLACLLRVGLQSRGLKTTYAAGQIVPLIIGSEDEGMRWSEKLKMRGILATVIRPPTVAPGSSLIRFTLTSNHDDTHIEKLLKAIDECIADTRLGV